MIRPININLNAAHPELPLVEATTFTGAPSSVFIRGVPKAVGNWSITAVSVAVTYPDNTTTARAAVESAEGVWVATIPGTATSGRTAAGFRILADGIDENGAAVTGYVLGFADFSVLSFTPVPAPGGTFYLLRYFDQAPATPKEGDAAKIDGVLKFYNGSAWEPFAAPVTLDDAVTHNSSNGVKSSGIWSAIWGALSALPAGFTSLYDWCVAQLAGKASTADATLTDANRWTFTPATFNGYPVEMRIVEFEQVPGRHFYVPYANDTQVAGALYTVEDYPDITSITYPEGSGGYEGTATRPAGNGYVLGSQSDKPLASESEAEALRQGKLSITSTAPQFQDEETVYQPGRLVVYNGSLYVCTQQHYGPWNADHFSAQNVVDSAIGQRVSSKIDKPTVYTMNNLASIDELGNIADSGIAKANVAQKSDIPYSLGTPIVIEMASSEVVEGETIYYGAVTLADRTANIVGVAVALDELRVTIPPAISGKVRDFGLYVAVGFGEGTALAAPALVPVAPTGETITMMNAEGEMPTLADGTTTESGTTVLYFTEVANGTFLVKGEEVKEIV